MGAISPAIAGANILGARSFQFAFEASGGTSQSKAIATGGYVLLATQDCIVKLGLTASTPAAAALPSTQPAITAPNSSIRVLANTPTALDVPADGMTIAALGVSNAGDLAVNGPVAFSTVK